MGSCDWLLGALALGQTLPPRWADWLTMCRAMVGFVAVESGPDSSILLPIVSSLLLALLLLGQDFCYPLLDLLFGSRVDHAIHPI